jgi:hypothetical protein
MDDKEQLMKKQIEHRNTKGNLVEHHFHIDDAVRYGIEEAIILYHLRFWLEKNKANQRGVKKGNDGKLYFWTFSSRRSLNTLFPYMHEKKIGRIMQSLENSGVIKSQVFKHVIQINTKWYTIPSLYRVQKEDNIESENEFNSDENPF